MARTIHLCLIASGLAMLAEVFVALFYNPAWMVQQNAITMRGILAAVAFGLVVALLDLVFVWLRTVRIAQAKESHGGGAAPTVLAEKRDVERKTEPPLAA